MSYRFRRSPLTEAEVSALERACLDHRERLVIFTLLDTGLRLAELASLSRGRIERGSHRLAINGKRAVPMSARVRALVEAHFTVHETLGLSARTINRLVTAIAQRAGIQRQVSPHVLRHTFAVTALRRGRSLAAIQRLMGHERRSTTEIYLNLSPEHVMAEYEAKF